MLTVLGELINDNCLHFRTVCGQHTWRGHESGGLLNMNDFSEILEQLFALVFGKVLYCIRWNWNWRCYCLGFWRLSLGILIVSHSSNPLLRSVRVVQLPTRDLLQQPPSRLA